MTKEMSYEACRTVHIAASSAVVAVCFLVASCAMKTSQPSDSVQVVEAAYAATAKKDVKSFAALLAPDVEWTLAESDGLPYEVDNPIVGPQALLTKLAEVGGVLQFTHEIEETINAGDTVVVTGIYHGLYVPTGAKFDTPFVHIWRISDSRIASFQQFVDTAPVLSVVRESQSRGTAE